MQQNVSHLKDTHLFPLNKYLDFTMILEDIYSVQLSDRDYSKRVTTNIVSFQKPAFENFNAMEPLPLDAALPY